MPIARMDHFTILTTNAEKTVAFYNDILGFTPGPRPAFSFPGAWLYNDGKAVLHVVEKPSIPKAAGCSTISPSSASTRRLSGQAQGARHQIRPAPAARERTRRGLVAIVLLRPERGEGRDRLRGERDGRGSRLTACSCGRGAPLRAAAKGGTFPCATTPSFKSAGGRSPPASAPRCRSR